MKNIKEFYQANKKLCNYTIIGFVVFILIIVAIAIFLQNKQSALTYTELEKKLVSSTKSYLQANSNLYPTLTKTTTYVDSDTLIAGEYITDLDALVGDNNCSATVIVTYVDSDTYTFKPQLYCAKYQTTDLIDQILDDSDIVTTGQGLYVINDEYVYRGENPNNYVSFAGRTWRIVKMSANGEIQLILSDDSDKTTYVWDDRYNTESNNSKGVNDYTLSRIQDSLYEIAESTYADYQSYLIKFSGCIGNRSTTNASNTGVTECLIYSEEAYLQLMPVYDYINASTDTSCSAIEDSSCQNYNYLNYSKKFWLATASNLNTYQAYYVNARGVITTAYTNTKTYLRYVITLDGSSIYDTGDGTEANPYTIK